MQQLTGALASATSNLAPDITCYLPQPGLANGAGIVIFPGGGYRALAEHEGAGHANFFAQHGYVCFVVTYRLGADGFQHPAMLEDGLAALETVYTRAAEFDVDPQRIGVMGSSAGGHLAAHTLVAYNQYESAVPLRPSFGILCYPVITMQGEHAHAGCRSNLLGENADEALARGVSCQEQVSAQTPPCFIWHTWEDASVPVEHSLLFASALRQHGVSFELHVYGKGRHGLGLGADFCWSTDCLRWLNEVSQVCCAACTVVET